MTLFLYFSLGKDYLGKTIKSIRTENTLKITL